jgi:hypothetical protein
MLPSLLGDWPRPCFPLRYSSERFPHGMTSREDDKEPQFGIAMSADTDLPTLPRRTDVIRRMMPWLLAALATATVTVSVGILVLASRWFDRSSDYYYCVNTLHQIHAGMPVSEAVQLMERALPDEAPISRTPEPMTKPAFSGPPVPLGWRRSCLLDEGCDADSLSWPDDVRCWANHRHDRSNRMTFEFVSQGADIGSVAVEACVDVGGHSSGCFTP